MNKETSSPQKPEQNGKLKEAINTLKFFDHRVRQTLKERKTKGDVNLES
jgi:hypothetical protein